MTHPECYKDMIHEQFDLIKKLKLYSDSGPVVVGQKSQKIVPPTTNKEPINDIRVLRRRLTRQKLNTQNLKFLGQAI